MAQFEVLTFYLGILLLQYWLVYRASLLRSVISIYKGHLKKRKVAFFQIAIFFEPRR